MRVQQELLYKLFSGARMGVHKDKEARGEVYFLVGKRKGALPLEDICLKTKLGGA
jgi:hypothetical protein